MSGTPLKVVELVASSTAPVSVIGNGAGKTIVSDGEDSWPGVPVRYTWPCSGVGYSGEVAVDEPTVVHVPDAGLEHSTAITPRFAPRTVVGSVSFTDDGVA